MINIKKQDPVADAVKDILQQEALKGNQHKIDKNKNNKIDAQDFKILRGEKKVEEGWDDMIKAGQERAEKEKKEKGTGKFDKKEIKPGVTQYTKKPVKYDDDKTQKEEVEQIEEKEGYGSSDPLQNRADYAKRHGPGQVYKTHYPTGTNPFHAAGKKDVRSTKMHAYDIGRTGPKGKLPEEVEQIDELNKSTLGSYVKKATADAVISRKIGSDFEHQASRSRKTSMKNASTSLSDKYKSMARKRQAGIGKAVDRLAKEEVEQVQEKEMTSTDMAQRERIVKSMKKGFSGFRKRYGDRAKSVMYATATKQAMKEDTLEEGKRPEGDTVPFVQNANTTSSPMKVVKEVAKKAMSKVQADLKAK